MIKYSPDTTWLMVFQNSTMVYENYESVKSIYNQDELVAQVFNLKDIEEGLDFLMKMIHLSK